MRFGSWGGFYDRDQKVSFQHEKCRKPSLKNVSLTIAGKANVSSSLRRVRQRKTTVTRLINGLIPHFYEGKMEGCAMVNGPNVMEAELTTARIVGKVAPEPPQSAFFWCGHHQ